MQSLCPPDSRCTAAYATASESNEDDSGGGSGVNHGGGVSQQQNPFTLPPKRLRPEKLSASPIRPQSHHMKAPIPGRYISKGQRAAASDPIPYYVAPSPVIGSISDSDVPHAILKALSVNAVQWSTTHAHLIASAGMDHTVSIWNIWSRGQKMACSFDYHHSAVKDVKWSQLGLSVLSCGYDCASRLVDVEKGMETQVFKEDQIVEVV